MTPHGTQPGTPCSSSSQTVGVRKRAAHPATDLEEAAAEAEAEAARAEGEIERAEEEQKRKEAAVAEAQPYVPPKALDPKS